MHRSRGGGSRRHDRRAAFLLNLPRQHDRRAAFSRIRRRQGSSPASTGDGASTTAATLPAGPVVQVHASSLNPEQREELHQKILRGELLPMLKHLPFYQLGNRTFIGDHFYQKHLEEVMLKWLLLYVGYEMPVVDFLTACALQHTVGGVWMRRTGSLLLNGQAAIAHPDDLAEMSGTGASHEAEPEENRFAPSVEEEAPAAPRRRGRLGGFFRGVGRVAVGALAAVTVKGVLGA